MTRAWLVSLLICPLAWAQTPRGVGASSAFGARVQELAADRPMIFSVNPVGNGSFIGAPRHGNAFVGYDELIFQKCSEVGSRSARVLASWREVEENRGDWDWSNLDREIELCQKYHIEPVVLICNIPAWVSPTGEKTFRHPPKEENADDFNEFITRMARRYKGKARYYEFWNEENGCSWINDGCKNAHMAHTYLPWLRRVYHAIKAVDPDAQVAIGGLDDAEGHAPLFVQQCYELRAEEYDNEEFWDAIADHPYDVNPDDPIDVVVGKLDAIRKIAADHGDTDLKLWITEYGWGLHRMSLEVQKEGTIRFLTRFAQPDQKDLIIAQQLALADFEPVHFGWGLCDMNLRPRPAYYAFQNLARGGPPDVMDIRCQMTDEGKVLVLGKIRKNAPKRDVLSVEITDESRQRLGLQPNKYHPYRLWSEFENLPRGVPLLATVHLTRDNVPKAPIARASIILPPRGQLIANGDFENLFRAGIPWGWIASGASIWRDGGTADAKYRRQGDHAAMLIMFDNLPSRRFDDALETSVVATKDQRFEARCFARYVCPETHEPTVLISLELIDALREQWEPQPGLVVGREWTELKRTVTAPCDTPTLAVRVRSDRFPEKMQSYICIDDVSLTPVAPQSR